VQTRRLATSFEPFTRSVALTRLEKSPHKATCVSVLFSRKSPKPAGRQSVKHLSIKPQVSFHKKLQIMFRTTSKFAVKKEIIGLNSKNKENYKLLKSTSPQTWIQLSHKRQVRK